MDIFFILLVLWTVWSIYVNVIQYKDYKYPLILLISWIALSFVIHERTWLLFLTLLVTNMYYLYQVIQPALRILGHIGHL